MTVNFRILVPCLVALFLGAGTEVFSQEKLCPDGKRSYFGVCPDDGNQSRPLPSIEPRPTPAPPQPRSGPSVGSIVKDCATCSEMVEIPAGSYIMGFEKEHYTKPVHSVYIHRFLMSKTEVTQKQWLDIMGRNPSHFVTCGLDCPVENVSWNDVQQFIKKLNQKTGQKYRLPSEAEWEYAARAGTTTLWSFGDDESQLAKYAWYSDNGGPTTHEVAQKLPNAFGLFDMHGNVWEWTQDCRHENYVGAPTDSNAWTTGCVGDQRVLRGGGLDEAYVVRSSIRIGWPPDLPWRWAGFRLVRDLPSF